MLTPAMSDLLYRLGGRWVVQTDSGLRDAQTGIRVERPEDVVKKLTHEPQPAPEHADIPFEQEDLRAWLTITGSLRHPNPKTAPFGQVIRRVAESVLENVLLEWGWDEPLTLEWDDAAVAEDLRQQFGGAAMIHVAGADEEGRRVVATTDVSKTDAGAEEVFSITLDVGPGTADASGADFAMGTAALEALTENSTPLIGFANATIGHPDLHRWPWLLFPSVPMGVLIGAPGVSRFGIRNNPIPLEERFVASYVGARRRESLLVELGEVPSPANALELRDLIAALGADAAMIAIPDDLITALFGQNPRTEIEKEHARILAEYEPEETGSSDAEADEDAESTAHSDAAEGAAEAENTTSDEEPNNAV